ncbi:MAG: TIGR02253 family HAD-type hydrolase [Candidatus Aenigmarchaeota archaeon]|nr:TIGR02253 family HAD-type hydrolase [Candidatus Aenigmarchaeota archaeon]
MIKAVIFDLDNTLIDFMSTKKASCDAAIGAMIEAGLKTPKQKALKALFSLYREKGIEHQTIFKPFLEKTMGRVDYKIMAAGIVAYRKMKSATLMTYPSVKKILGRLNKRYKLAILSDAPALQAWTRLVEMGLENYFDAVITYNDTHKLKPHPRPFIKALRSLGVKPAEAVMIGDSLLRDVRGAKRMGMKTVLASYGNTNKRKLNIRADAEISDIKDLPKILSAMELKTC